MVTIMPDFLKVVMLAANSDALLSIGTSGVCSCSPAKENIFELIHAGIGKEEGWVIVRNDRCGRDYSMPLGFEELEKFLSYLERLFQSK